MTATFHTSGFFSDGPWQIATHVSKALCTDGKRRYAQITGVADTFFSIPAKVKVKERTVSGYVTGFCNRSKDKETPDYKFIAYSYGKNGHLLPGI